MEKENYHMGIIKGLLNVSQTDPPTDLFWVCKKVSFPIKALQKGYSISQK